MATNKFYVYKYLREQDSQSGNVGTPYYIGKGSGDRAWSKRRKLKPTNPDNIVIIQKNMEEQAAFDLEVELIATYGRVDTGTGILRNLTDGGEGTSGIVRSLHQRQLQRQRAREHWNNLTEDEKTAAKQKNSAGGKMYWAQMPATARDKRTEAIRSWYNNLTREEQEIRDATISTKISNKLAMLWDETSEERKKELADKHSAAMQKRSAEQKAITTKLKNEALDSKPLLTCEHCGFVGKNSNMTRYHGDNCKHNPIISKQPERIVYPIVTCPYCNKSGINRVMNRYHFDKCKLK